MKNIVFDLGGVLFARDKSKCTPELLEFFSFLRAPRMPLFWEEYDRGTSTLEEVTATISGMTGRPVETCAAVLRLAVDLQEPVKPTERLVGDLKAAGYRLYVLSNMSREFIDFLRRFPVYGLFDGGLAGGACVALCAVAFMSCARDNAFVGEWKATAPVDMAPQAPGAAAALGIHGFVFDHRDPDAACDALRRRLLQSNCI